MATSVWPIAIVVMGCFAAGVASLTMIDKYVMTFSGAACLLAAAREASLRAGVPVDRLTILIYVGSAMTAGIAGVLHTARFSGGSSIAGEALLMSSVAAVVIGGVSLYGGRGNIMGTVIGALIIAILTTGLVMLNVEPFWQYIVIGIVVILAVLIDQARDLVIGRAESQ